MRKLSTLPSALVVGLVTVACGPEPEPEPDFIWRGDNLDIYGYDVDEAYYCGGTFEHMDEFMGRVAEVFGAEMDVKPIVRVGPPEFVYRYCPEGVGGCIDYPDITAVRADRMPLDHELVHLAVREVSSCPVFLGEGLAEYYALSAGDRQVKPGYIEEAIAATLDETMSLPGQYYSLAGHFVGFLIEKHGLEQLLRVCDRTGGLPTPEQFYEAFEDVYGEPLDWMIPDYAFSPMCTQRDYARKLTECDQPVVGVLEYGQALDFDFDIDCDNSATLGPGKYHDDLEQVWVNQRIELVPLILDHRVTVQATDDQGNPTPATVTFMTCERCTEVSGGIWSALEEGTNETPWELEEGVYVVAVGVPLAEAKRIHLTLISES